jgi:hypothetical protein
MRSSVARRPATTPAAVDVWFDPALLWVRLADGREVGAPLAWFPRLAQATPEELRHLEVVDQGYGIHWPDLDEDISVLGLLGLAD